MTTALQAAGARDDKESRWAPIFTNRFFLGLQTNRNPLRAPTGVIYESYYHIGAVDSLIGGTNVEISNRLTICRRPGNTAGLSPYITGNNIPDIPDSFFSFHETGGNIRVLADTPTAPYLIGGYVSGSGTSSQGVIPIFTKASGVTQSFFQGIGQSLYITDAKEQVKWLDFGVGNPGNSFTTVTNVTLTSNVATITAANNFAVGQTVVASQTTNTSGLFNGTWVVTAANLTQFSFNLTHANVGSAADTGFVSGVWNLQIAAPTSAPTLSIVSSGSAATVWQGSTVFSTMGLSVDSSGNVEQLISVNALGGNATQFGTTGNGQPAWNQTPGGTTSDNTITWTNYGPVVAWTANTVYNNFSTGGTTANPCYVYDQTTGGVFGNSNPGNSQGTSGASRPNFINIAGSFTHDGSVKWFCISPVPQPWIPSHTYPAYAGSGGVGTTVAEPYPIPTKGNPLPNNQPVYIQTSGTGGSSASSGTSPFLATLVAGNQTNDNQLIWLNLGTATWGANTVYTQWTGTTPVFSVVQDSNSNMQVCTTGGTSGASQPLQSYQAGHVYALNALIIDTNGFEQKVTTNGTSGSSKTLSNSALTSGVATYTSAAHGFAAGQQVTVTASTSNAAYNVVNAIIQSVTTNTFTVNIAHDNIATGADTGIAKAGPTWNQTVAGTTTDGTVTWTNQGAVGTGGRPTGWGVNYGDNTSDGSVVWTCVGPQVSWVASTLWNLPFAGFSPPSSSNPYGGSEVIGSAFVQAVIQSGKSAASSTPIWSVVIGNFVLDPSTSNTGIVWRNVAAQSANSLAFTKGYGYVYAYESRSVTDTYSPLPLGGGTTPPGVASALGAPTGSADGSVSTASAAVQMAVGANAGAVIYVSGLGSTDPQVDTIDIFRTFDGGATFFLLTKIPNPAPKNGIAQPWTFADFLPDVATSLYPGLNTLVVGPINHSNDAPLAGAINLTQYFGRIWYSVGSTVYASQGPNVGGPSQPPGNGYTAYNPGQFFTFTSPVVRLVPTTVGLLVYTTSDLGIISGGPIITTMFPNIYVQGLGLSSYNALTVHGSLIDLFTADNQVVSLDPNQGVSKIGYPIGDQFFKYGTQTTTFSPSTAYLAYHTQGLNDQALFVADGSTGWFRGVANLAPDSAISGPVWSPKAAVVGGVKAVNSLEIAPGQHALLLGATSASQPVLVRDSTYTTFSDNSNAYEANFIFGSMVLANPGQLAELGFVTCEFIKTGTSPKLAVLMDEISDTVMAVSAATQSGTNTTYTYTLTSGVSPVVGAGVTISGMANAGNNGTFAITAIGAGTFTVSNTTGVTATVQTGTTTAFEDLSGYIASATGIPPQDSGYRYGLTLVSASLYSNRYYFAQSVNGIVPPQGTYCRHMQVKIDMGSTDTVQNEILTMTLFGSHFQEI